MSSQFFGLNVAYTGLLSSNAALNTTANNISNVQTEGYSRQQVVQQAGKAIQIHDTYGSAGAGVETVTVERVRDEFYDNKYWNNHSLVGEFDVKSYYMEQIEAYFSDDGIASGFKTIYDKMMVTSMEELLKNPSDTSTKAQFVGSANSLTEYFNNLAGNLEVLQKDLNQEIKLKVDEINALAGEIATLNKQINVVELSGVNVNANELRDRRSLLIDQLSEIVDVSIEENPIMDTNYPDRETGATRCIVKIAGGQLLVDASEFYGLECVGRENYEKVNQTDIDGLYDVYWSGTGEKFNLYNSSMGGELQGLIQMRDGTNGEYFHGGITKVGQTADNKRDTVTIEVTENYLKDLNLSNLSDQGGIINLGNQDFYYDSWELTKSFDDNGNEVYSYTFTLSDAEKNQDRLTNSFVGKDAMIGAGLSYQGIPYYMSQMNVWVRNFSENVNDILESGIDGYGNEGSILFTGDLKTDNGQIVFDDEYRYDTFTYEVYQKRVQANLDAGMTQKEAQEAAAMKITEDDASYYRLTANNFNVLTAMSENATLLATRKNASDGVESSELLNEIQNMATDSKKMNFRNSSASEFLQCILSDVALNANRANTLLSNYQNISTAIETQRLSISGVDEDEEAINLVKYQNGYNLASKMIQVFTEIYDRLILETGV